MKFNHKCIEARWNEETSKWHVKLEIVGTGEIVDDSGDVLMLGSGTLNNWKWPDIKGLRDFKGKILHSADWDTSYDATDKKIAVIGAGSSGIQIVPALLPKVKSIDHYVRGRTWISASFGNEFVRARNNGKDGNFEYTPEEIKLWKNDPDEYIKYRKVLEYRMQEGFSVTHRGSKALAEAWVEFAADMKRKLEKKTQIAEHLIPEFPPHCKRLTPGPGYLEALTSDNVEVIPTPISHVDATGVATTDGVHREVDLIVCATGFDTSFRGRFPIYGRGGVNLQDRYKKVPESYLSLAVDGFPNFFQSFGPNSGVGTGNQLILVEAFHLYVGQVLERLAKGNVKTIEPKRKPVENFNKFCDAFFERTVFSADCGSWYKTSPVGATEEERRNGRVTALWPGSSIHAVKVLEKVRFEDFEITTVDDNELGWMGNGWSAAERAKDLEGLSWYINNTRFTHHELEEKEPLHVENGKVVTREENGVEDGETTIVSEYKIPVGIAAT